MRLLDPAYEAHLRSGATTLATAAAGAEADVNVDALTPVEIRHGLLRLGLRRGDHGDQKNKSVTQDHATSLPCSSVARLFYGAP